MTEKSLQVVSEQVAIETKNIEVVPYGLKFTAELSREEFGRAFNTLNHVNTMYQWYLGDLVAQADWQWKGEMYDMMMDVTGLERDTLKHLASVSRTFPVEARETVYENIIKSGVNVNTMKLGYSHFFHAASLMNSHPEQAVDFLIRAGKQGWTVAYLREQITRWKNNGKLPEPKEKEDVVIPDGWERVKAGEYTGYVPTTNEDVVSGEKTILVAITETEARMLMSYLSGNSGFESLVKRLNTGLEGL